MNNIKTNRIISHLSLIIPFALFAILIIYKLFISNDICEFDPDEGINISKAILYNQEFQFFNEIWSDQPPLFTWILAQFIYLFGSKMLFARSFIALFSALILFCFWSLVRSSTSAKSAMIVSIILIFSWHYIELSISVMIGLPALAIAMLSIYLFHSKEEGLNTVLSATLFAISVQMKFLLIIILPTFFLIFFIHKKNNHILKQFFIWCTSWLSATFALVIIFKYDQGITQLFNTHFSTYNGPDYSNFTLIQYLKNVFPYIPLCCLGMIRSQWKKLAFPASWMVLAITFTLIHRPIWYHHLLLITIPLLWVSALGIEYLLTNKCHRIIVSYVVLLFLSFFFFKTNQYTTQKTPNSCNANIISYIKKNAKPDDYILSDRPVYGPLTGTTPIPQLTVFTSKRLFTAQLCSSLVIEQIKSYKPRYILIERFNSLFHKLRYEKNTLCFNWNELKIFLRRDYLLTIHDDKVDLFERSLPHPLL